MSDGIMSDADMKYTTTLADMDRIWPYLTKMQSDDPNAPNDGIIDRRFQRPLWQQTKTLEDLNSVIEGQNTAQRRQAKVIKPFLGLHRYEPIPLTDILRLIWRLDQEWGSTAFRYLAIMTAMDSYALVKLSRDLFELGLSHVGPYRVVAGRATNDAAVAEYFRQCLDNERKQKRAFSSNRELLKLIVGKIEERSPNAEGWPDIELDIIEKWYSSEPSTGTAMVWILEDDTHSEHDIKEAVEDQERMYNAAQAFGRMLEQMVNLMGPSDLQEHLKGLFLNCILSSMPKPKNSVTESWLDLYESRNAGVL